MIRHVVAFTLEGAPSERAQHAVEIRERLTSLVGRVAGLRSMHVEPDIGEETGHWHLVLVSEHDNAAALRDYQTDPHHVEMAAWSNPLIIDRAIVDYCVPE